jgi:hypothetical protein
MGNQKDRTQLAEPAYRTIQAGSNPLKEDDQSQITEHQNDVQPGSIAMAVQIDQGQNGDQDQRQLGGDGQ